MYARCGQIEVAKTVFDSISSPNIYMMLTAYAGNGHFDQAFGMFQQMPKRDLISWNQLLQAAVSTGYSGLLVGFVKMPMHNVVSCTTVIVASSRLGYLREAKDLFDRVPARDPLSWNTLAQGYIFSGAITVALVVLERMPLHNIFSINAIVTANAELGDLDKTRKVFEEEIAERNLVTWNTMLAVFSDLLEDTNRIFAKMPQHDMVSWNTIVTAHCRHGAVDRGSELFAKMPDKSIEAWNSLVRCKAENGQLQEAIQLLEWIDRLDIFASNTMIVTYGEAGLVDRSKLAFDRMLQRDVVSWSSICAALAKNRLLEESLASFDRMPARDVPAWNAMIQSCAQSDRLDQSKLLFDRMPQRGLESWTTLIAAYATAGCFREAKLLFDRMPKLAIHSWTLLLGVSAREGRIQDLESVQHVEQHHDVVSSTATLTSYARNGHFDLAIVSLRSMLLLGLAPNDVTFTAILTGLSDAGMPELAREYFICMPVDYFVVPNEEHYSCLVQILGKANRIESARELLRSMPFVPDMAAWTSLLDACRAFGDVDAAKRLGRVVMELDPEQSQPYVILHNTFVETFKLS